MRLFTLQLFRTHNRLQYLISEISYFAESKHQHNSTTELWVANATAKLFIQYENIDKIQMAWIGARNWIEIWDVVIVDITAGKIL